MLDVVCYSTSRTVGTGWKVCRCGAGVGPGATGCREKEASPRGHPAGNVFPPHGYREDSRVM